MASAYDTPTENKTGNLMGFGIAIGLVLGLLLGAAVANLTAGMAAGLLCGVVTETRLDQPGRAHQDHAGDCCFSLPDEDEATGGAP